MQGHILYAYTYTKVGAVMNFVQSLPRTDEARSLSAFDGLHVPCIFVLCQHFSSSTFITGAICPWPKQEWTLEAALFGKKHDKVIQCTLCDNVF